MDPTPFTTAARVNMQGGPPYQPGGGYGSYQPYQPYPGAPPQTYGRPYGETQYPPFQPQAPNYTAQQYDQHYFQQQPQPPYYGNAPPQQPPPSYGGQPNDSAQQSGFGGGLFQFGEDSNQQEIPPDKLLTEDTDIAIRHGFVRKVYGILFCQLLVTFGLTALFVFVKPAHDFLQKNAWLGFLFLGIAFAAVCAMTCCSFLARTFPTNYILLGLIAVCFGFLLGFASGRVSTISFLLAAGATAVIALALSLFACQTRWDFTGCGVFVFVAGLVLMIFGIVMIFVRNRIAHIVYAALGTLVMSFYLVYDTQQVVGGKHRKYQFSIDDYAFGALTLYMDIINLFLYLLQLIAAIRGE